MQKNMLGDRLKARLVLTKRGGKAVVRKIEVQDIAKRAAAAAEIQRQRVDRLHDDIRLAAAAQNLRRHGVADPVAALADATLQRFVAAAPVGSPSTRDELVAANRRAAALVELAKRARTAPPLFKVLRR